MVHTFQGEVNAYSPSPCTNLMRKDIATRIPECRRRQRAFNLREQLAEIVQISMSQSEKQFHNHRFICIATKKCDCRETYKILL
jgi:hypothetical protein